MINEHDEELHPPGDDPHWQESYYFNWSTDDGRTFGLTRIGLNHASATADALVVVLHDGEPELVYAAVGEKLPVGVRSLSMADGLTVGALTYTMVDPLKTWRIELDGRNRIELTWRAFTPAIDFHEGFPGDLSDVQRHFEQSGRVEGHLLVGDRTAEVSALGQRDKSWGVRDWNGIRGWDWIVGQFGEDLSFNATLTDVHGEQTPVGFVFDDGAVHMVKAVDIRYAGADPHQPETARVEIDTLDGARYVVTGRARARLPVFKEGLFIEETQFAFECEIDGLVRSGAGVVEHAYHVGSAELAERMPRLSEVIELAEKGTQ